MSNWRAQGKQVLQDGRHFADAAGELEAMMIVNAMRALDEAPLAYNYRPPAQPSIGDVIAQRGAALCRPRREQDEYVCSKGCGVRWDVREPAPRCGRAP